MTKTPKAYTHAENVEHYEELDRANAAEFTAAWHREAVADGLRSLVMVSGENSRDHGFHEGWPDNAYEDRIEFDERTDHGKRMLQLSIVEKLALIHEEVSESLGEIRSGRGPLETYFVDKKGVIGEAGKEYSEQHYETGEDGVPVPLLKPEGFLVELADAAIRIGDLVYLVHGREEFVKARQIKHEYNATRPYKHGRKF